MNHLGYTRTCIKTTHALIAPDGHVKTTLPGWHNTSSIVLISPQLGARFTQFLAVMEAGGKGTEPLPGVERFIFVVAGGATLTIDGETQQLDEYGYAYLPAGVSHRISAERETTLNVFERRYVPLEGVSASEVVIGNEKELSGEPFLGDEGLICRKLLPEGSSFDMAVNTMSFEPGVTLPFAETHVMEHGLLMLTGEGIYRLADDWYPVTAGDTIFMAPYCPQWFGALGKTSSKYLLYKDSNRDPFALEQGS